MLLSESVSDQIKYLILNGSFSIGEKIPNELELAERLGVSRNTIRDAVKLLVSKNILKIKRGKGTFVSLKPGIIDDPFGLDFMDKESMPNYLSEIRRMIEPEIAYLAAKRATEEEIERLGKISSFLMKCLKEYLEENNRPELFDLIIEADLNFHDLVCQMCRNPIVSKIFPVITKNIWEIYSSEYFRKALLEVYKINTHHDIYQAIKDRNSELARSVMVQHLKNPSMVIQKYLNDSGRA